ncbi:hypothetical protein M3J09_006853 [Ascochyta lentis]
MRLKLGTAMALSPATTRAFGTGHLYPHYAHFAPEISRSSRCTRLEGGSAYKGIMRFQEIAHVDNKLDTKFAMSTVGHTAMSGPASMLITLSYAYHYYNYKHCLTKENLPASAISHYQQPAQTCQYRNLAKLPTLTSHHGGFRSLLGSCNCKSIQYYTRCSTGRCRSKW